MKLILILVLSLSLMNCKNKEHKAPIQAEIEPNLQEIKTQAPPMGKLDAEFIKMADAQKALASIEDQIWHYNFALSLKETTPKENIYKGQWLDLSPTGNYIKGLYNDTTERGRYIYDEGTTLLELRATSDTSSEWKIKVDQNQMILIGTSKYGNNPWQMKLVRKNVLPAKE